MNTKRKFESTLHRELYKEMLMLVRKEKRVVKTKAPINLQGKVVVPYKGNAESVDSYAWLIFSGLILLGYGMFHFIGGSK